MLYPASTFSSPSFRTLGVQTLNTDVWAWCYRPGPVSSLFLCPGRQSSSFARDEWPTTTADGKHPTWNQGLVSLVSVPWDKHLPQSSVSHIQVQIHTHAHTRTHMDTWTLTHTEIHTHIDRNRQTNRNTHTLTHTQGCSHIHSAECPPQSLCRTQKGSCWDWLEPGAIRPLALFS